MIGKAQRSSKALPSTWGEARCSPRPEDVSAIRELLDAHQPGFRSAVVADIRITLRFRGEQDVLRSRLDVLAQLLRLMWVTDSFFAQVCYRARVACRARRVPLLPTVLHRLAISTGQLSIGDHVVMRPGVYVPHGQVVIDGVTYIGPGAVLRPFVTLGLRDGNIFGPYIGARARIGTGTKVFGPIRVGAGAQTGANAVVNRDVPAGRSAVGVPARVLP